MLLEYAFDVEDICRLGASRDLGLCGLVSKVIARLRSNSVWTFSFSGWRNTEFVFAAESGIWFSSPFADVLGIRNPSSNPSGWKYGEQTNGFFLVNIFQVSWTRDGPSAHRQSRRLYYKLEGAESGNTDILQTLIEPVKPNDNDGSVNQNNMTRRTQQKDTKLPSIQSGNISPRRRVLPAAMC